MKTPGVLCLLYPAFALLRGETAAVRHSSERSAQCESGVVARHSQIKVGKAQGERLFEYYGSNRWITGYGTYSFSVLFTGSNSTAYS
jgi:hypothetical protein